jgi:hypothetical protein
MIDPSNAHNSLLLFSIARGQGLRLALERRFFEARLTTQFLVDKGKKGDENDNEYQY